MPDLDHAEGWLLTVDGAPQSYVDLAEPTRLEFEYARRLAFVVDLMAPEGDPLRVLHLGGGGLTLPRYIAATRPGSPQLVVERDAALSALVRRVLPLPPDHGVDERHEDARVALAEAPTASADLLIADVFHGSRTPASVTSIEFVRDAARVVGERGVYLANLADSGELVFGRAQAATLRAVFPIVCLVAEPSVLRGRRYGNVMLAGSARPLPIAELVRLAAGDPFPARVCHGEALDQLIGDAEPTTDDDATGSPPPPRLA
jgi:spermidine synthase